MVELATITRNNSELQATMFGCNQSERPQEFYEVTCNHTSTDDSIYQTSLTMSNEEILSDDHNTLIMSSFLNTTNLFV